MRGTGYFPAGDCYFLKRLCRCDILIGLSISSYLNGAHLNSYNAKQANPVKYIFFATPLGTSHIFAFSRSRLQNQYINHITTIRLQQLNNRIWHAESIIVGSYTTHRGNNSR
jgi:hypothetical protein